MLISEAVVVALVLLMSSASAEAMHFSDRPGLSSGIGLPSVDVSQDRFRWQIDSYAVLHESPVVQLKTTDRPRPLFTVMDEAMVSTNQGPGRLSAEFSVASRSLTFKRASLHRTPNVVIGAMEFEDQPRTFTNQHNVASGKLRFSLAAR